MKRFFNPSNNVVLKDLKCFMEVTYYGIKKDIPIFISIGINLKDRFIVAKSILLINFS